MNGQRVTDKDIQAFYRYLIQEEKSAATVEKYLRDVRAFLCYVGESSISKETVIGYKKHLQQENYAVRSINSMLASLNSFLMYIGCAECKVKAIKLQKQTFCTEDKELSKAEYEKLLDAAGSDEQLRLIMQTICSTGIRVSELQSFTVEAVRSGKVIVDNKGKVRTIFLPSKLVKLLMSYIKSRKIGSGVIFLARNGKPMGRKTIWAKMKGLCKTAGVAQSKVFPHNLRKLFARAFYAIDRDIAKLADILGHSSINTTRIYIMTTGVEHRRKIERLGLVFLNESCPT